MKKNLVAVYGSLRKNFGNHELLENAEFLGEFITKPEFTLYTLGGFPGLKENGNTSIVMEVYSVTDLEARNVDNLEGYSPNRSDNYFYDKIIIDTPFGKAATYIYVPPVPEKYIIECGDWKEFKNKIQKVVNY